MPVKKIEKRELLQRCWEVFHRHGYHGTSVSMLAEATGLGKSGLMHHHLSKESLMRAVVEYAQESMREIVFSVAKEDLPPEQRLEKLLRRLYRSGSDPRTVRRKKLIPDCGILNQAYSPSSYCIDSISSLSAHIYNSNCLRRISALK